MPLLRRTRCTRCRTPTRFSERSPGATGSRCALRGAGLHLPGAPFSRANDRAAPAVYHVLVRRQGAGAIRSTLSRFEGGLLPDRCRGRLKVDRQATNRAMTPGILCDLQPQSVLSPTVSGEESRWLLPDWRVRSAFQIRGVRNGAEGVVDGITNRPCLGSGPESDKPRHEAGAAGRVVVVSQQWLRSSLGAPAGGGLVVLSMQGIAPRYSYIARRSWSDMS
jgi:hypothetical protein